MQEMFPSLLEKLVFPFTWIKHKDSVGRPNQVGDAKAGVSDVDYRGSDLTVFIWQPMNILADNHWF